MVLRKFQIDSGGLDPPF